MIQNHCIRRRAFFAGCLAVAGCGVVRLQAATVPGYASLPTFFQPTLAMLTKADFEPCLGAAFQLHLAPEQTVALELIEVTGYPPRAMHHGATREPFALVFRGAKELQVSQRMFRLTHPELGSHEIFLVPIGPDEQGMRLEAVFS